MKILDSVEKRLYRTAAETPDEPTRQSLLKISDELSLLRDYIYQEDVLGILEIKNDLKGFLDTNIEVDGIQINIDLKENPKKDRYVRFNYLSKSASDCS